MPELQSYEVFVGKGGEAVGGENSDSDSDSESEAGSPLAKNFENVVQELPGSHCTVNAKLLLGGQNKASCRRLHALPRSSL